MSDLPVKPKRFRKSHPIDWDLVARLSKLQCTQEEIAFACKKSVDTLQNRAPKELKMPLSQYMRDHAQGGKVSLRRWQWAAAESEATQGRGKCTMLIWLGKQYLGQSDNALQNAQDASGGADPHRVDQLVGWLREVDQE